MNLPSPLHNKSESLLLLALAAYRPNPDDAEAQAQVRRGFEAVVSELRRIDAIPPEDIDEFVALAKSGADASKLMVPATLMATMLPDVDYYAAMVAAGFSEENPPMHPQFLQAGQAMADLVEKHGDAAHDLPEFHELYFQVLRYAPAELKQMLFTRARESGLLPEVTHVDELGRPVYSLEQVAATLGTSPEELQQFAEKHTDELAAMGGLHTGPVFPIQ